MTVDGFCILRELVGMPIFGVTLTLLAFQAARTLHARCRSPLSHPLLSSSLAVILVLGVFRIDYTAYDEGGRIVSFFLSPATVALAVPLYKETARIEKQKLLIILSCTFGALAGMAAAVGVLKVARVDSQVILSMLPKSVTTPIAMEISRIIGGVPALTSVFVVLTGLFGAVFGPWILALTGVKTPEAVGLSLGTAAHGIGTGRALEEGAKQGAYSGLAMGVTGLIVTLLAPILAKYI